MITVAFFTLLAILFYETLWFLLGTILKRHDIADIAWGLGFIVAFLFSFFLTGHLTTRQIIVGCLVHLWGLRLFLHIGTRYLKRKEDSRYLAFKQKWKNFIALRSYVFIFLLQGVFLWIISLQLVFLNVFSKPGLNLLDFLGLGLWVVGFICEALADWQLRQFIKNPLNKGKIMDKGLWAISRHPNYFGEVLQWWSVFLFAVHLPMGWLMIISPLTISYLILFVSGIPMLEAGYKGNALYEIYKKRTSVFVPWFPKKS